MDNTANALAMVVDDDDMVRRLAAHSLKRLGYRVVEASDGHSALKRLESGEEDVEILLSDVRMPGMTGNELARIVSQRWPGIPVLLTSGHARTGDFESEGILVQVLPKPYTRAELADALALARTGKIAGGLPATERAR